MFNITFASDPSFPVDFTADGGFDADFENTIEVPVGTYYDGSYELTPTNAEQIIPIAQKVAMRDFVINPIPQNYGLITWNGAILTVS